MPERAKNYSWPSPTACIRPVVVVRCNVICVLPLALLLENIAGIYAPLLAGACIELRLVAQMACKGQAASICHALSKPCTPCARTALILLPQLLLALVSPGQPGPDPRRGLPSLPSAAAGVAAGSHTRRAAGTPGIRRLRPVGMCFGGLPEQPRRQALRRRGAHFIQRAGGQ